MAPEMDGTSPFASTALSPEVVIARVRRHLAAEPGDRRPPPPAIEIEQAATAAVTALWDCRVKSFIEVIALRQARELLTAGVAAEALPAVVGAERAVVVVGAAFSQATAAYRLD